jgi:hypothetical protein
VGWLAERVIRAGRTTVGWICAAFGLPEVPGAAIIPVSRGAMGQIWRLDLGADRFAVKELFWDADEESARNEAELTAQLEAAGIRLPASVPGADGMLNFLQSQAGVALDPHADAGHRQHADDEISDTLAHLPTPGLIAQLIDLAAPLTS